MENKQSKNLLDDRRVTIPLSVLIAVILWMVVTMFIDPNSTQLLSGVPVDFSYNSSVYINQQLDIVNNPQAKVTLRLSGDGYQVAKARPEDFQVYPDYSMVTGAGQTDLALRVRVVNSNLNLTATVVNPERVTVVFDEVKQADFKVEVQTQNITVAEGYVLQSTVASPASVSVRGPASEVEKIKAIQARIEPSADLENLSETKLKTVELVAVDAQGNPLELEYTTLDNTLAEVTLSVYQTKELPLRVNFINVPEGFDVNSLKYTLSQETMLVSGTPETLANLTELAVSDFDLTTYQENQTYSLTVNLPKGVESKTNLATITLSFDSSNLTTRTINVSNIRTINVPANYDVKVEDKRISNVRLVGPKEVLDELSPDSVVATVDLSQSQIASGTENLSVRISVPSSNQVFTQGNYSVECSITVKSGS
ncbi:MAG: hypothetical protein H9882_03110 [Candidatus Fournierella pullistercoris]|uniref:YbbR-like protein n=1 Tax=Candidatus Allofournierella pullistercoris TaxID=2838597 RepID=A0A948T1X5_9FIRM|nr:hypothetical protein [Candidatus Fournierella pullistercoris]